jgi:hypothetical protein
MRCASPANLTNPHAWPKPMLEATNAARNPTELAASDQADAHAADQPRAPGGPARLTQPPIQTPAEGEQE